MFKYSKIIISTFILIPNVYSAIISSNTVDYTVSGVVDVLTINNGVTVSASTDHIATGGLLFQDNSITTSVINNGTITGNTVAEGYPINLFVNSSSNSILVSNFTNNGTLSGRAPIYINSDIDTGGKSEITNFTNSASGVIYGKNSGFYIRNADDKIGTLTNHGSITADDYYGIDITWGTVDDIINSGTITASTYEAIILRLSGSSVTNAINNSGTITGNTDGISVVSGGSIGSVINTGTITGITGYSIDNAGIITTIRNDQNNLTLNGNLPTNYSFIANSSSDYGKLIVSNPSGSTNFGIYSATNTGTYTDVISGVTSSNLNTLAGTYGAWTWTLSDANTDNSWDLKLAGNLLNSVNSLGNTLGQNAAYVIDQNGDLLNLFNSQTTTQELSEAVNQTLPLLVGSSSLTTLNSLSSINKIVRSRMQTTSGLSSGDDIVEDRYMWFKTFGSTAKQDDKDGVTGFDADTYGFILGGDKLYNNDWLLGIALAYANSDVKSNSNIAQHQLDADLYQVVFYGNKDIDLKNEFNFQIDGGVNKNKGFRSIAFNSTSASSEYDSHTGHIGIGLNHTHLDNNKYTLSTMISEDYTIVKDDAYTESGAGLLNLDVKKRTTEQFLLSVAEKYNYKMDETMNFDVKVGGSYDFINEQSTTVAAYSGAPSSSYRVNGLKPEAFSGFIGLGLIKAFANTHELSLNYDAVIKKTFTIQTASIKYKWLF